ncbi:hypothetical protein M569_15495 [Genlisea aurea]|uniref:Uncharacterized protein n=1 Tax=Genlisea aurea TaxID=192259 RepID=S8D989_9LAMI|nr:hypothetical protein M569_15495 [Genlisea aurea]
MSGESGDKTNNSRRPKRKKTLLELRDEESSLIQERRELKRRLSKLNIHLEEQRSINQELKRMKKEESRRRASSKSELVPDLNIPFEEDVALLSSSSSVMLVS